MHGKVNYAPLVILKLQSRVPMTIRCSILHNKLWSRAVQHSVRAQSSFQHHSYILVEVEGTCFIVLLCSNAVCTQVTLSKCMYICSILVIHLGNLEGIHSPGGQTLPFRFASRKQQEKVTSFMRNFKHNLVDLEDVCYTNTFA